MLDYITDALSFTRVPRLAAMRAAHHALSKASAPEQFRHISRVLHLLSSKFRSISLRTSAVRINTYRRLDNIEIGCGFIIILMIWL